MISFRDDEPAAPDRQQNILWQRQTETPGGSIIGVDHGVFTTGSPHHLHDGDRVFVQAGADQGSSGTWPVTVVGPSSFSIPGISTGISYPGDGLAVYGAVKTSAYLPNFVGDGVPSSPPESPPTGGLAGAVPAPALGDAAAGKFLFAGGTWEVPSSLGPAVPITRLINTEYPLEGGGPLSSDIDLSVAVFVGDGAVSSPPSSPPGVSLPGVVPAAAPGDSAAGKFLFADGTWQNPAAVAGAVPNSRLINTTAPLTGGGDLSADLTLGIDDFVGDSGSPPVGGARGAVPAPSPGDAALGYFLSAGGGWAKPGGDLSSTRRVDTTAPLTGGGDLSSDRTLGITVFVGDSGSPPVGGLEGSVPAPSPGDAAAGKFLSAAGGWEVPGGTIPSSRRIDTTAPLTGGGDFSADRTFAIDVFSAPGISPPGPGVKGAVPAPQVGDASKFLRGDGAWAVPSAGSQPYDLICSFVGKPGAAALVFLFTATRAISFSANWSGAAGTVGANPTSSATYTVQKNGGTVGTVVIGTGGAFTFATSGGSAVTLASGDRLTIIAPSSQDATLSDVAFTLAGTR